ncbi:16126_t:CDS:2, partial [Funneliformis caledonium]
MSTLQGLIARLSYPALRMFPPKDILQKRSKISKPTFEHFSSPSTYGLIAKASRPVLCNFQQSNVPLTLQRKTNIVIPPNYFERYKSYSSRKNRETQDIRDWCVQEVNEYLQMHLEEKWTLQETKIFENNKITGSIFLDLTIEQMKSLNISLVLAFKIDKLKKELRQKIIYIQKYDDEGNPLPNFERFIIDSQEMFEKALSRYDAMGLELIENQNNDNINDHLPKIITSFDDLVADQKYRYDAAHIFAVINGITW